MHFLRLLLFFFFFFLRFFLIINFDHIDAFGALLPLFGFSLFFYFFIQLFLGFAFLVLDFQLAVEGAVFVEELARLAIFHYSSFLQDDDAIALVCVIDGIGDKHNCLVIFVQIFL